SIAGNGVTQHDAAGVLAQVVGSGAFSGSNVNMVARTAARMKEVVGQSVDETVSQFKRLKGDPVNAIIELNNSLHFLTAAQYQQIAAAYAQGDSERAAALAMKAYSDSTNQRLNAVKDNLGTLESAWNWVRHSASDAWDAMLGVGRKPSSAMKRQSAFTDWQVAEKNYKQLSENLKVDPDYAGSNPLTRRDAARLRDARKMVDLKKQEYEQADKVWATEGLAAARAVTAREEQDGLIKGQQQFNNLVYAGLSPAEKRVRVEKNLNALIRQNRQAAKEGKEKLWTDADIARARAGIEKQYKDPKSPAYHNDEAGRLLLQYSQQQAQTEGQIAAAKLSTTEKMTEAHKQFLAFQQRITDLSGKKLTADEKSVLAHRDEIEQALQKLDISQQDLQHQNALNELKKKTLTLTSQLADEESRVRQQHAMALATMGMGDQQRGRYEERLKIQQRYQEQLEQLKRDSKAKGTYGSEEYRQAEQKLQDSLDR
ncbi:phage tail tape measure protein, partial [Salmonella enterica]|nr:phage tail tape measure protein [Salmonella enterica]